jgi:uncharacterized membrane protein HdeD (DUF308 family)
MKKASLISTIVIGAIGILVGVMFAFLANVALTVICIICGVLTLLSGVPQLVDAISGLVKKQKMAIFDLVMSIITVIVGLLLIFSRNEIIMIIVGAYLIVFPVLRILIAKEKMAQLKSELPAIILGVALVLIGPGAALDFIFKIAGAVVIVFSSLYIVFGIVAYFKASKALEDAKSGTRVFVDSDGNGTIDTVYVDTTGDGKVDTKIEIDENK